MAEVQEAHQLKHKKEVYMMRIYAALERKNRLKKRN